MVFITIVTGAYKPTYILGASHCIYANAWGILMGNVTIYSIHGSYGLWPQSCPFGKNRGTGLIYHLSSWTCCIPVVKGVSSNPSINQPTNGKRTSMYGPLPVISQ